MQTSQASQACHEKRKRKQARDVASNSIAVPFKEWCRQTGVSYKTGRAAGLRGEIEIIKIGRSWYARRSEQERFLQANTHRYGIAR